MATGRASESRDGDSLRVSINNKLRDVIFEDIDDNSIASLLYDLQLIDLIKDVLGFPDSSIGGKEQFTSKLATAIGDITQSNYGHLFEESRRTEELIHDHINLNRFIARLLSVLGVETAEKGDVVGLDDALFILSTALEDHPESHHSPDIDIPAAAQYVTHAGSVLFEACMKGLGEDLTTTSPLWATRGKKWADTAGLSRERWSLWKNSFEVVQSTTASEETKEIARMAVCAMERADGTERT